MRSRSTMQPTICRPAVAWRDCEPERANPRVIRPHGQLRVQFGRADTRGAQGARCSRGCLRRPNTDKLDIVVSGHTDAVGTPDYNQKLSERRTDAARQYLISQHGIDGSRLIAKGFGKSQLLLPTDPD